MLARGMMMIVALVKLMVVAHEMETGSMAKIDRAQSGILLEVGLSLSLPLLPA